MKLEWKGRDCVFYRKRKRKRESLLRATTSFIYFRTLCVLNFHCGIFSCYSIFSFFFLIFFFLIIVIILIFFLQKIIILIFLFIYGWMLQVIHVGLQCVCFLGEFTVCLFLIGLWIFLFFPPQSLVFLFSNPHSFSFLCMIYWFSILFFEAVCIIH